MSNLLSKSEIQVLLRDGDPHALREAVAHREPFEAASLLQSLCETDGVILFGVLPRGPFPDVFKRLSHRRQRALADVLASERERLVDLLNTLAPDDRTAFFEELPGG